MSRILYIEASPRKERSASIAVAKTFLESYKQAHPQDELLSIDLWRKPLPTFDQDVVDAKYAIMHNKPHTDAQKKAWRAVEDVISEFKNADKYVFSLPMWNFSIPYILKHYIDTIVQPGYTFRVTPSGEFEGLVTGKPVVLFYARGGAYGPGTGAEFLDLQKSYMETILKFIGFQNIQSLLIEPTLSEKKQKDKMLLDIQERAKQISLFF